MKNRHIFIIQVLLTFVITLAFYLIFKDVTYVDIVNNAPNNTYLKILFLIMLFAMKSLTIFFPILALQIACGLLFDLKVGLLINVIGMIVSLTLPYFIGRYINQDYINNLFDKYPKLRLISKIQTDNEMFFAYITRVLGLPMDVVSLYMGVINMNYISYIRGSLIGVLPGSLIITYMSKSIIENNYYVVIYLMIFTILIALISLFVYFKFIKKN